MEKEKNSHQDPTGQVSQQKEGKQQMEHIPRESQQPIEEFIAPQPNRRQETQNQSANRESADKYAGNDRDKADSEQ